jgi:hypothetical protein
MSRATVGIVSLSAVAAVILFSPPGGTPKASARPTPEQVEAAISHAAATAPAVSLRR